MLEKMTDEQIARLTAGFRTMLLKKRPLVNSEAFDMHMRLPNLGDVMCESVTDSIGQLSELMEHLALFDFASPVSDALVDGASIQFIPLGETIRPDQVSEMLLGRGLIPVHPLALVVYEATTAFSKQPRLHFTQWRSSCNVWSGLSFFWTGKRRHDMSIFPSKAVSHLECWSEWYSVAAVPQ